MTAQTQLPSQNHHVCPWWFAYTFDNPVRKLFHKPHKIFGDYIKEGMTVMEIWPGGGWYTEVIAPVMRHHGQFIVAGYDVDVPDQPEYRYGLQMDLLDKFSATPGVYDQVAVAAF